MDASNEFWTEEDAAHLRETTTLEEAGRIAIGVLERMRATGKEIVQVCGPMTTGGLGSLEANMERFRYAIARAKEEGLLIFDQTPFQEAIDTLTAHDGTNNYCDDILEVFFRGVLGSGHVSRALFLPDWESSRGACWEWEFVRSCGIPASPYPEAWLLAVPADA